MTGEREAPYALTALRERMRAGKNLRPFRKRGVIFDLTQASPARSEITASPDAVDQILHKVDFVIEWVCSPGHGSPISQHPEYGDDERQVISITTRKPVVKPKTKENTFWHRVDNFEAIATKTREHSAKRRLTFSANAEDMWMTVDFFADAAFELIIGFGEDSPYISSRKPIDDMRDDETEIIKNYLDQYIEKLEQYFLLQ